MSKNNRALLYFILVIEITYVLLEIALNSSLVNVSAGLIYKQETINFIESFGRNLSGVGLGLTLFALFGRFIKVVEMKFLVLLFCMPVGIVAMHKIQNYIVDDVVVANATTQDKARSEVLLSFRDAMALGLYTIDPKIPLAKAPTENNDTLVFISLFPLLFAESPYVEARLRKSYKWYEQVVRNDSTKRASLAYSSYKEISSGLLQLIKVNNKETISWDYLIRKGNRASDLQKAAKHFVWGVQDVSRDMTSSDKKARSKFERYVKWKTNNEVLKEFSSIYRGYVRCGKTKKCKEEANQLTTNLIGVKYSDAVGFKFRTDNFLKVICTRSQCPLRSLKLAKPHLLDVIRPAAMENYGVYIPSDKDNNETYVKRLRKIILSNAKNMDNLSALVITTDSRGVITLDTLVRDFIASQLTKEFSMTGMDTSWVGYNINEDKLLGLNSIQKMFSKLVGPMRVTSLHWSQAEFYKHYDNMNTNALVQNKVGMLKTNLIDFKSDGERFSSGNQLAKMVYIPPVALVFSLVFGVFSLCRIPARIIQIKTLGSQLPRKKIFIIQASILVAAFCVPIILNPSPYSEHTTKQTVIGLMGQPFSPIASVAYSWVLSAEPILYPVGKHIASAISLKIAD